MGGWREREGGRREGGRGEGGEKREERGESVRESVVPSLQTEAKTKIDLEYNISNKLFSSAKKFCGKVRSRKKMRERDWEESGG